MSKGCFSSRWPDYLELTKPRLVSLTLWSTAAGLILADHGPVHFRLLCLTLLGSGLVAAGSMSLNEWMERGEDARMTRTSSRPLPAGRLHPNEALAVGFLFSLAGLAVLYYGVNGLSAWLAFSTLFSYVAVYTPLKKITPLCTLVGAVPGAIPPLIGWAAVSGTLSLQAWVLFTIIFFWQMPHFYAISWFWRKDYQAAGFRMLSVKDPGGKRVAKEMFLYNLAMIPVSLLPFTTSLTGKLYFVSAIFMGAVMTVLSALCLKNLDKYARLFFRSSLLYLTVLFILMVLDKR